MYIGVLEEGEKKYTSTLSISIELAIFGVKMNIMLND